MARLAAGLFWASTIIKLALVSLACIWPIRDRLWHLKRYLSLIKLYTLADSNLDVLALAWLHTGVMLVLLAHVMGIPKPVYFGPRRRPPYGKVRKIKGWNRPWGAWCPGVWDAMAWSWGERATSWAQRLCVPFFSDAASAIVLYE